MVPLHFTHRQLHPPTTQQNESVIPVIVPVFGDPEGDWERITGNALGKELGEDVGPDHASITQTSRNITASSQTKIIFTKKR